MLKRVLLGAVALSLFAGAIAFSGNRKNFVGGLQIDVDQRNPWTHLRLNDAEETFHFVVVSDRTGGHRARIFSEAVERINLMQPAFVISVGDLIEGYTKDIGRVSDEWKEFQTYTHKLQMPFFYVPGNHDLTNAVQEDIWKDRFGRRYYHFLYKDVLFLAVNTDDPNADRKEYAKISPEQVDYFKKVLADNKAVRWTIVCLHKPIWTHADLETNGWLDMEKDLAGRDYTVFAGHIHKYQKFVRQGMNYYQLATTGGGSKLRGLRYGEFDHVAWVTMGKQGPTIANVMLDGIYPEDLKRSISDEEGVAVYNRKPTQPVRGKVLLAGTPVPDAYVTFNAVSADGKTFTRVADAFAEGDGAFAMSSYKAFDGVPTGPYTVTVVLREPFFEPSGKLGVNRLPAKYADAKTSPLRFEVRGGVNELTLDLAP
jgi:hypothetical protein